MGRTNKTIEDAAVNAVRAEVLGNELLEQYITENEKTPFFDGHINVYHHPRKRKEDYQGEIRVQVRGMGVSAFKQDKCKFRVDRTELKAYKKNSGILFFVVEVLKGNENRTPKTKVFWRQLLPYDIDKILNKIKKGKNSINIDFDCLANRNLTTVCQNFLEDWGLQKHGKIIGISEIKGLDAIKISGVGKHFFGFDNRELNDFVRKRYPFYIYGTDHNDISFPIANFVDDGILLALQSNTEVFVGEKSFGNGYFKKITCGSGSYYQFGQSCRHFPDGKIKFSAAGNLDERIQDFEFILSVFKGENIYLGGVIYPYKTNLPPKHEEIINTVTQGLEIYSATKKVFQFLGYNSPIDITTFSEKDWHLIEVLAEHVVHHKQCTIKPTIEGVNRLRISDYSFLVVYFKGRILNFFSKEACQEYCAAIKLNNGEFLPISPYAVLEADAISKSSNFDSEVVMESIKSFQYTETSVSVVNNLLLEAIKAIDLKQKNERVVKFSNDLADYLIENDDNLTHRLNKMQVHKRFAPLDKQETDWLLTERSRQNDPKYLCGIAILLDDTDLFDEQFGKLTYKQRAEFRKYPIMKLLNKNNRHIKTGRPNDAL